MPDLTLCKECESLFLNGRWSWGKANKVICSACKRSSDNYPRYQFHKNEHLEFINKLDDAVSYSFLTRPGYR